MLIGRNSTDTPLIEEVEVVDAEVECPSLKSMRELASCGAVLGNTPLQHPMVVKKGASAEAIWGDCTSFYKGEPASVFKLQEDCTSQPPQECLCQEGNWAKG